MATSILSEVPAQLADNIDTKNICDDLRTEHVDDSVVLMTEFLDGDEAVQAQIVKDLGIIREKFENFANFMGAKEAKRKEVFAKVSADCISKLEALFNERKPSKEVMAGFEKCRGRYTGIVALATAVLDELGKEPDDGASFIQTSPLPGSDSDVSLAGGEGAKSDDVL